MTQIPALKREPTRHWWETVTYTSHDGRETRSKSAQNAAIDLYGSVISLGAIRHERCENGTYRATQTVLDLRDIRAGRLASTLGSVSWQSTAEDYARYTDLARRASYGV